jgi:purine nucleosidase
MHTHSLIIDCDPGVDDAIALLLTLASPSLELLAITTVAGNVPVEITYANAHRICALVNRSDIPIYAGCPRPLVRSPMFAADVHGENGLGGVVLPDAPLQHRKEDAVDILIQHCRAHRQHPLTIAALGPLTNLAVALVKAPDIAQGIEQLVIMGGGIAGGNVTPYAEFNFYADPHAAQVVLTSGIPITLIPLDLTHQVIATTQWRSQLQANNSPVCQRVVQMLSHYGSHERRERGWDGPPLHDPCVIGYLLAPELFTTAPAALEVELSNSDKLGQTACQWRSGDKAVPMPQVVSTVEAAKFLQMLYENLVKFCTSS